GLFEGRANCLSCHRVSGRGSRRGPDLSNVGLKRSADMLLRSLLDPDAAMLPQTRPVRVVVQDGTIISGRRLNEDRYTIQLIDDSGRLVAIDKTRLKEYSVLKTALMPSFKTTLAPQELADMVAYLLSLKG